MSEKVCIAFLENIEISANTLFLQPSLHNFPLLCKRAEENLVTLNRSAQHHNRRKTTPIEPITWQNPACYFPVGIPARSSYVLDGMCIRLGTEYFFIFLFSLKQTNGPCKSEGNSIKTLSSVIPQSTVVHGGTGDPQPAADPPCTVGKACGLFSSLLVIGGLGASPL
ncbi:hypothetical protein BGX38DRAFT_98412 [Terfezia claveryi]|nr:hypothetical protein BGX38DRAFT_98412 [Terfezia claveryi]